MAVGTRDSGFLLIAIHRGERVLPTSVGTAMRSQERSRRAREGQRGDRNVPKDTDPDASGRGLKAASPSGLLRKGRGAGNEVSWQLEFSPDRRKAHGRSSQTLWGTLWGFHPALFHTLHIS